MSEENGVQPKDDGLYTLSNGVKLRLRSPGAMAIQASQKQLRKEYPEPKPPVAFVEAKDRDEANPNDPDYVAEHAAWEAETIDRLLQVLFTTGVEIVEVPEGLFSFDGDDFVEYLETIGVEVARGKTGLRTQWLKLYAVTEREDLDQLSAELMRLAGVPEVDVQTALDTFRSDTPRGADSDVPDNGRDSDGDPVPAGAARTRSQDRRA